MKKRPTLARAKTLADKYFSYYTRLKNSDLNGFCKCITCNSVKHWKEADCGHFCSRIHLSTRWYELNANFQCKRCNGPLHGEQFKHGTYIDKTHGAGTTDSIIRLAHQSVKMSVIDIIDVYQKFKVLAINEGLKRGIQIE